ncbi:hypothetical protein AB0G67_25705 [Streptomyces sp. NPDC021056]
MRSHRLAESGAPFSSGAIMERTYESMAGIAKDPAHPGFEHFFLRRGVRG